MATLPVPRSVLALVVDDDPTMRLMLESTLARSGLRTAAVGNARTAQTAFEAELPDVVLLDIGLPDVDGCTLCSMLRALPGGRDVPIIMLTGHDDAASVGRAYEAGATDFIAKPINWEILAHRVRYILRSARAFADVETSRARMADAQRVAGLGSWDWDSAHDEVQCSIEAHRILGHAAGDAVPSTFSDFFAGMPEDDRERLRRRLVGMARTGGSLEEEQSVARPDGEVRVLQIGAEARVRERGRVALVQGTVQDVTERRLAEERVRHLAYHDSLTGLPNRAWLGEELDRALARARRRGKVFAVMLLDIDRFKRINDTLGHVVGDQLLCAVADRLNRCLRREDSITQGPARLGMALSRLGGDEFCIVLSELDVAENASKVAARVLEAFAEPFALLEHEAVVSPSIGIAVYPNDADTTDGLIKAADTAMYHTKKEGRNNFAFYSESMNARALERLTIEAALRRAIERDQLVLHYQPIVSLETGEITGFEALVRWQHPELGLLMPGRFVEIAEDSGLIVPMGEWVLRTACRQSSAWQAEGLASLTMSVNVSGEQFRRSSFLRTLREVLDQTGITPNTLKLEITESVMMRDVDATLRNLASASEMGVCLSIDDFGTGYSSLAYIERLPVQEVKLDRAFIVDIVGGGRNSAIATAVIQLASDLALTVVAEGVETEAQARYLQAMNCPRAQGYYFCRPQPAEHISALLRSADQGRSQLNVPLRIAAPDALQHSS